MPYRKLIHVKLDYYFTNGRCVCKRTSLEKVFSCFCNIQTEIEHENRCKLVDKDVTARNTSSRFLIFSILVVCVSSNWLVFDAKKSLKIL